MLGTVRVWLSYRERYTDDEGTTPLVTIDRKPAFLDKVRRRLTDVQGEDAEEMLQIHALLLAQYGDFSGLARLFETWQKGQQGDVPKVFMVALRLTKDPRYLVPLRKKMEQADDQWELRELLKWLRGVSGPEARKLRREINRRMRALQN